MQKYLWKSHLRVHGDLHEYKKLDNILDSLYYFKTSASVPVFLARESIVIKMNKSLFYTLPFQFLIFLFQLCKQHKDNINHVPLVSWSTCSKLLDTKALAGLACKLIFFFFFLHLCYLELLCKHLECNFYIYWACYATALCSDAKGI